MGPMVFNGDDCTRPALGDVGNPKVATTNQPGVFGKRFQIFPGLLWEPLGFALNQRASSVDSFSGGPNPPGPFFPSFFRPDTRLGTKEGEWEAFIEGWGLGQSGLPFDWMARRLAGPGGAGRTGGNCRPEGVFPGPKGKKCQRADFRGRGSGLRPGPC